MRLALGIEGKNLKISGPRIIVDAQMAPAASPANGKIAGAWTTPSAMNGGHFRLRYIFNADGSYSFKSKRNITTQRWWTIQENVSYSVNGDTLTITPQTSKSHAPESRRRRAGDTRESA